MPVPATLAAGSARLWSRDHLGRATMDELASLFATHDLHAEIQKYRTIIEDPRAIGRCKSAYKARRLTLFLGAGVSDDLGIPRWDKLVGLIYADVFRMFGEDRAAELALRSRALGYNNSTLIRQLETAVGYPRDLWKLARHHLYENFDEAQTKALIEPLCNNFILNHGTVRHIVSYNFDNVIERYLKSRGNKHVSPIYSGKTYVGQGDLRIYHPHGYLPHPADDTGNAALDEGVVFSERSYNSQYMDTGSWENVVQLHHLMSRTCLFIGASLSDPNVRRLLDHSQSRTVTGRRHLSVQRHKGDKIMNYIIEKDFASLGVETLWVREYADIPKLFPKIAARS